jgi:hypothetical protein
MADELYRGLWKYKLGKRYDIAKSSNDSRLNEGRDYTNDLMLKGLSRHITRNDTMLDFVRFIQDMFVNGVKTVTQLKLYKAFAMPKDYLKVK